MSRLSWRSQRPRRWRHEPKQNRFRLLFLTGVDPVANGFISSLSHPTGNATGIFILGATLGTKRLELLHEIVPTADVVAILISSSIPDIPAELSDAAGRLGVRTIIEVADTRDDFAGAFEAMVRDNCRALYVPGDAVFNNNAAAVVALAEKFRIPTIYPFRESWWLEDSPATGQISPRPTGLSEPMLGASYAASDLLICRCSKSRKSSLPSMVEQPKTFISCCPRPCSHALTR